MSRRWLHSGLLALACLGLTACGNLPNTPLPPRPTAMDLAQNNATPNIEGAQKASILDMVKTLQSQSQHYAALAHLQAHDNRWGPSPESQLIKARSLMATDQDAAARALYLTMMQGELAGTAHHGLGLLAARQGQFDQALLAFGQAARLLPTDPVVLGDLGYALMQRGRWAEARTPLLTAAQLAPEDSRSLSNLALYHFKIGQAAQAEQILASPHVSAEARQQVRTLAQAAQGGGGLPTAAPPRPSVETETNRPPAR